MIKGKKEIDDRWQKNPFAVSWSKKVGRKASEIFEGPNSSLRKTFDDAIIPTDEYIKNAIGIIQDSEVKDLLSRLNPTDHIIIQDMIDCEKSKIINNIRQSIEALIIVDAFVGFSSEEFGGVKKIAKIILNLPSLNNKKD